MSKKLKADIDAAMANDPAARTRFEVWLTYSSIKALSAHRRANWFYKHNFKLLARIISQNAKRRTGIEIHPAATIEPGVFIDHGEGVVIGETAVVEKGCVIYQGVTLGGTGKERGKRHPTIMENVTISAGAKVLGGFTVGKGAKIGAGAVVIREVPPYATVVGVPGRIVRIRDPEKTEHKNLAIAVTALNAEAEAMAKQLASDYEAEREKKKNQTEKADENL